MAPTTENYGADAIQVLEGLEAVRNRPGMYIGSTGPLGLPPLVYELGKHPKTRTEQLYHMMWSCGDVHHTIFEFRF